MTSFYVGPPEVVHFEIEVKLLQILKESKKSIIKLLDIPKCVMECLDISFPFKEYIFNNEHKYWLYYLEKLIVNKCIYGLGDQYSIDGFYVFDNFLIPDNGFNEEEIINQIEFMNIEESNNGNNNISLNTTNKKNENNKKRSEIESWYRIIDSSYSKELSDKFCPTKTIFDKYLEENKARRDNDLINQLNNICTYNDKESGLDINIERLNLVNNVNGTLLTPDYHLYENIFNEYEKKYQLFYNYFTLHS